MSNGYTYRAEDFDLSWQPPGLWMAVREGLCWCNECAGKHPKGFGKTKEEAVAELLEQESTFATNGRDDG